MCAWLNDENGFYTKLDGRTGATDLECHFIKKVKSPVVLKFEENPPKNSKILTTR